MARDQDLSKGILACTQAGLEVSFNQVSPDSSTPELLGHNAVGSSPAKKYRKAHHSIIVLRLH